jgi:hypothetical protein
LIVGTAASYVPYKLLPKPAWSRTLRSATSSLFVMSDDWMPNVSGYAVGRVETFLGAGCVEQDAHRVWEGIREHSHRFWERTSSPEGLLAEALAQSDQPLGELGTVEIVCRDGSLTYREAIRRALPEAVRVSDRWHLWGNLCDKVLAEVRSVTCRCRSPRGCG